MAYLAYIQFCPDDWLHDPVSSCSLAAQGLWLRMMCLMHVAPHYGYLALPDGTPYTDTFIARKCGVRLDTYRLRLAELDKASVPRRTESVRKAHGIRTESVRLPIGKRTESVTLSVGVIYSKRMVDDQRKRRSAAMRKGLWRERQSGKVADKADSHAPSHAPSHAKVTRERSENRVDPPIPPQEKPTPSLAEMSARAIEEREAASPHVLTEWPLSPAVRDACQAFVGEGKFIPAALERKAHELCSRGKGAHRVIAALKRMREAGNEPGDWGLLGYTVERIIREEDRARAGTQSGPELEEF